MAELTDDARLARRVEHSETTARALEIRLEVLGTTDSNAFHDAPEEVQDRIIEMLNNAR